MNTYHEDLLKAGLNASQTSVYEFLIKNGPSRASRISRAFEGSISRTMIYAILENLVEFGIVEKNEQDGEVARFTPTHPSKLQEFAERRRQSADLALAAAASAIPKILSDYNLTTGKPGVRFFEGPLGMQKILDDVLTSKTDVLQYADVEITESRFKKESDEHVKKRGELNIKKRLLVVDSPFARTLYKGLYEKAVSDVRFIKQGDTPFNVTMFIYDNKISYTTLLENTMIGVIIEDSNIYNMHRHLFDTLYEKSEMAN